MQGKDAFSYVYHLLDINGYLEKLNNKAKAIKTNKILFFAELYHRYFFKEPMITDISFKILPQGPALNKEDIDWENAETNYNFLRKDEKETIKICMKEWLCQMSPEDLVEISHGVNQRIPLSAWKNVKGGCYKWGTEIPSKDIDKDAEILHNSTKHYYIGE